MKVKGVVVVCGNVDGGCHETVIRGGSVREGFWHTSRSFPNFRQRARVTNSWSLALGPVLAQVVAINLPVIAFESGTCDKREQRMKYSSNCIRER